MNLHLGRRQGENCFLSLPHLDPYRVMTPGGAAVAVDLGFPLYPGEQVLVSADDLQAIYIASDTAAVNVYYIQGG